MNSIQTNNNYSLNDTNNYRTELNCTLGDIVNKYNILLAEYLHFIVENIGVKNSEYSKFIIERGLETIAHVFTLILYYSRNIDMAYYHGQRSFYFYVEFIGQISEDQHTFLNLSSRDAAMFVYKKTIFELSNDYRKNITELSKDTIEKMDTLNYYSQYRLNPYDINDLSLTKPKHYYPIDFDNDLDRKKLKYFN